MIKKELFHKVTRRFLRPLGIVILIGFAIGFIIDGRGVFTYWREYLLYYGVIGMSMWVGNESFSRYID
jgi:hypothetical protein